MTWEDLNLTKFMAKPHEGEQYTTPDFDLYFDTLSATKIDSGKSTSKGLIIDYDIGAIDKKEGQITRLSFGKFTDGKFGLRVYDSNGVTAIDQTA